MSPSPPAKKKYIYAALCLLLIPGGLIWMKSANQGPSAKRATESSSTAAEAQNTSPDQSDDDSRRTTMRQPRTNGNLAYKKPKISASYNKDALATSIHTRIPKGSSVMTGGHQLKNGKFEFTLITPCKVSYPNGTAVIQLKMQAFQIESKSIGQLGLSDLVTDKQDSDQHAEIWSKDDVSKTMSGLPEHQAVVTSSPTLLTRSSKHFQIMMGNSSTGESYEVTGTAYNVENEETEIKIRIERVEAK